MTRQVYSSFIRLRAIGAGSYDVSGYVHDDRYDWTAWAEAVGPAKRPQVRQHDNSDHALTARIFREAHRVANTTLPADPLMSRIGTTWHRITSVAFYPYGREWFAGPGIVLWAAPLPGVPGHAFGIEQTSAGGATVYIHVDNGRSCRPPMPPAPCTLLTDAERGLFDGQGLTDSPNASPRPAAAAIAANPRLSVLLETPRCPGPETLRQAVAALPQVEALMLKVVDRLEHA